MSKVATRFDLLSRLGPVMVERRRVLDGPISDVKLEEWDAMYSALVERSHMHTDDGQPEDDAAAEAWDAVLDKWAFPLIEPLQRLLAYAHRGRPEKPEALLSWLPKVEEIGP